MDIEEYKRRSDAFVQKMLEETQIEDELKEAAAVYWERIFSESDGIGMTEEQKKVADERWAEIERLGDEELRRQGYDI